MKMNKLISLFLLISLFPIAVNGQAEYFSTDSTTRGGVTLIDGGAILNSKLCQVKIGNKITSYTPYQVKQFGFKNGRVYLSKDIQLNDSVERVFLERLYNGKTTLYLYRGKDRKTFYLEKDSSLFLEIPRRTPEKTGYKKQLEEIMSDCSNVLDAIRQVSYNKASLTRLTEDYNNCELKPFPHIRFGLTFGYKFMKMKYSPDLPFENQKYFDFKYDGGYTLGSFIDVPILMSDYSVHSELNYSSIAFSYNTLFYTKELDYVGKISSLSFPLLIRYTHPSNQFRPFANAGAIFIYNVKNDNTLYETGTETNVVNTPSIIEEAQFGYSIGGGIEYRLNPRNALSFEFRYNKQYGLADSKSLRISEFQLVTAFIF